ncbi:hypothetical protein BV898_19754, partial [Hypsibius exemplaris]
KKPCDYESITKNNGYLYDLENKRLRVRDPEGQVDFILDAQPADMDCNLRKVYHVRGGFQVTCCQCKRVTEVIENELSKQRYKRNVAERQVERPNFIEILSPSELAVEEAKRQAFRVEAKGIQPMQNNTGAGGPSTRRRRSRTIRFPLVEEPHRDVIFESHNATIEEDTTAADAIIEPEEEVTSILHGRSNLADTIPAKIAHLTTERAPTEADLLQNEQE